MARGPRLTPEQVEEMMIPKLVAAIYPVLIPIEQQDMAIQRENHARMTEVARLAWHAFTNQPVIQCDIREALHAFNEWADYGSNATQWLKNVRDGISTSVEAIAEMEANYERVLALARAACKTLASLPASGTASGKESAS